MPQEHDIRGVQLIYNISKLGILRRAVCLDDIPKSLRLWWRSLGIKIFNRIFSEERSDVTITPGIVPFPNFVPITLREIRPRDITPGDIVPPIFDR